MHNEVLCSAITIFDKYCELKDVYTIKSKLPKNILNAVLRILATYKFISFENNTYSITDKDILKIIDAKERIKENKYKDLIDRVSISIAQHGNKGFFDNISDIEYEIYSRCNFSYCYDLGVLLRSKFQFKDANILDMGGNSGGMATAILEDNPSCNFTIVDTRIPCEVGKEFKETLNIRNLTFVEGDFFNIYLDKTYDYIILSNILHDYSDSDCKKLLNICNNHSNINTKILIIEDILDTEIEPACVVEHGLNLTINTINGQQRTVSKLIDLMQDISFKIIKKEKLNDVQSLIIFGGVV